MVAMETEKKGTRDRGTREKDSGEQTSKRPGRKLSEYGKQLQEKQKVRDMYGMRERQFRKFFRTALARHEGTPGENLLSMLERRIDNAVYRLKFATSRAQARQIIVHGHVLVNGRKVYSPSYMVAIGDVITLAENVAQKAIFLEQVIDKRLKMGIKVPEWLELDKQERKGQVLRYPARSDIQVPIEEHLIVELYSK